MIGVVLFFVGAVLFVNGMAALGRADAKGTVPVNAFVGLLTLGINIYFLLARPFGEPASYYTASTGMLFSLTYIWNAANAHFGLDGRALGWFCMFVAMTAVPTSYFAFQDDPRFGVFWAAWGLLWGLFAVLLNADRPMPRLTRYTGYYTLLVAVATCWVPGYLILLGEW